MNKYLRMLMLALLMGLLGLSLQACGDSEDEDDTTPNNDAADGLQVGDTAPAFTLPAVGGEEVSLSDYVGQQPVLLYFHMAVG